MLRTIIILAIYAFGINSYCQTSVGIVTDFPKSANTEIFIDSLLLEIEKITGVNKRVTSSDDVQIFNISSLKEAQTAYQQLNADLIISIGGVSTKAISKISELPIPVIGIGVIDHLLQDIPYENGRSGKDNFTYLLTSRDIVKEIESFKRIIEFKNLTIVNDPKISKSIDPSRGEALIDSLENALDISIESVPADENINITIQNLGYPDAVYLSSLLGKSEAYMKSYPF